MVSFYVRLLGSFRRDDVGQGGGNPVKGRWLMLFVGALIFPAVAQAFTVRPPTFEQLVDGADQILRVRVLNVSGEWDTSGNRRVIRTHVRCEVLKRLKGEVQPEVTLKLLGGQIGAARLVIPNMPQFDVGARYIVFVKDNGRAVCPLLAVMHGSYELEHDPDSGAERVLRSDGTPLTSSADVTRPLGEHRRDTERTALSAPALTTAEFEAAIAMHVQHARAK